MMRPMFRGEALAAVLLAAVAPLPARAAEPAPTPPAAVAPLPARAADAPPAPVATPPAAVATPKAAPVEASPAAPALPASPPSPVPAANTIDPDAALKRVLRSGCRAGLAPVYGLVGNPSAPWAETVLRLCGEILRAPPRPRPARAPAQISADDESPVREHASAQEGRGRLVFWSSLYGIWLGIATDVLFDVNGSRSVILPPLLGMGAGLGLSLALTANVPLSAGQAWTIITGLDYGSINGALWAGGFDASGKGAVGTAVASSIASTAAGLAIADAGRPTAGDIELVRSGLLWGATSGALAATTFGPPSGPSQASVFLGAAIAMDAGFIGGLMLARSFELSRNRVLIIDAGALGGATTGLGVAWLALNGTGNNGRALAGSTLAGLLAGIAIATYATRNLDAAHEEPFASAVPAIWARDADGRWRAGTPSPLPVWDGTGTRLVGATVNAVAGAF